MELPRFSWSAFFSIVLFAPLIQLPAIAQETSQGKTQHEKAPPNPLGNAAKSTAATTDGQVNIQKLKGNKAIVEIPPGVILKEGDLLYVSQTTSQSRKPVFGARDYRAQISLEYMPRQDSEQDSTTTVTDLNLLFGKAAFRWEFGGEASLSKSMITPIQVGATVKFGNGFGGEFYYEMASGELHENLVKDVNSINLNLAYFFD